MSKGLPQYIIMGGEPFFVNTDYRIWLRFCDQFEKRDPTSDLDISYLFVDRIPLIETDEDVESILEFAYPPCLVPKAQGSGERVLDYVIDADYIYSAFFGQYGVDLLETDMHWHKFLALLHGLTRATKLQEILGYRCYEGNDKELVKLREVWALPAVMTEEDRKAKKEFDDYFG